EVGACRRSAASGLGAPLPPFSPGLVVEPAAFLVQLAAGPVVLPPVLLLLLLLADDPLDPLLLAEVLGVVALLLQPLPVPVVLQGLVVHLPCPRRRPHLRRLRLLDGGAHPFGDALELREHLAQVDAAEAVALLDRPVDDVTGLTADEGEVAL